MTTLSIIIVNFNTKDLVENLISSIHLNKPKQAFEIIVVDNASSDGSVASLRKFNDIRIIENKVNQGFARGNNQALKIARGECKLLLNSDIKVLPNSIDRLVQYAKKHPNVGAVVPRLLNPDKSIQKSVFHFPTTLNTIRQYWFLQKDSVEKYSPVGDEPSKVDAAVMAAFLITPNGLKKAKLLDERYFMYFEDIDYCRKLRNVGLDVIYLPEAKMIHHHGASGKNIAESKNQWRRLIPSSIIYHGLVKHYMINTIIWSGQKWQKFLAMFR